MTWLEEALRKLRDPAPPPPPENGWFDRWLRETGFLAKYPHYAGVLARMRPMATNTVPVMAVALWHWDDPASKLQLFVNYGYFHRFPEERAGVLQHEINHVLLGHLTNPLYHAVRHPEVMELAMEISADEFITEPLPPNGITLEAFAKYGIEPRQSTMERYRLLAKALEDGRLKIEDWWYQKMRDTHRPGQMGAAGVGLGDLIDGRGDGASERNWNRERGGSYASDPIVIDAMKRKIARHLRGERGGADDRLTQRKLAKDLQRAVMGTSRARLNWERILREVFASRRRVRPDYLRPNRRFRDRVGEIPGRTRRPPKPRLWIGIDTSGSMSGAWLDRIAREVERLASFARLTIVECDAAVHRVYPLPRTLGPFLGGGDTDFGPVFAEARDGRQYDGLVYFTDGKGDLPDFRPVLPTLWVLTHEDPFEPGFGLIVRMRAES